ncbi:MAG: DNA-3-methyladenine glycosylase 2 family protein [Candidatus Riflebacteria bacterium]|nr:DNA-3-methyladenine glycosylase 2 family protein [Candidatus Riflebacteria bacterium]
MKIKTQIENADIEQVKEYLSKKDKYMAKFLKIAPEFNLKINSLTSVYHSLIESIISQQLSGKAASTIFMRLCNLFNSKQILPLDIIRSDDDELRSVGISRPKIAAIRDLTDFELSGKLPDLKKLHKMKNEEIIENLTQVKGIGRWTVEMLLIFRLGRIDVFSSKDLGLRKGFAVIKGTYPNLPKIEEIEQYAEKYWKPYRSIASWYLWRACEG